MGQAMALAEEYRALYARGDMPLARQARQTIDELVAYRTRAGRWALPRPVAEAMGRPELAEVQS